MRKVINTVVFFCLMITAFSCNRSDDNNNSVDIGGKGGNAVLKITPQHHGRNIDSCTVYIKYNTLDAPTGSYDDSALCVQIDSTPVATFTQLKKGKYYLYGKGWDPTILQGVKGGLPYTITQESAINVLLPVTEDH